jgi:hypothetical protein
MGKSSSTPAAPDPYTSASAQEGLNKDTAAYNAALSRTSNNNGVGSSSWASNGTDPTTGAPLYSFNTQLAPQFQSLLSKPLDTSSVYGAGGGQSVVGGNNQIRSALLDQQMAYLQPQQAQTKTSLDAQLAAQGAMPGSEAYNNAQDNNMRQNTFQNQQAYDSATAGATSQQAQQQNIALQGLNAQQIQQQQPVNLFNALSGNGGTSSAGSPDIMSAFNQQYQGQLNSANADNASNNATTTSVASTAALAAIMF